MKYLEYLKSPYIVGALVIVVVGAFFLLRDGGEEYAYEYVQRGDIRSEVFESGVVKKGEELQLGFTESGTIQQVLVSDGQTVERGQEIARLDSSVLAISREEAASDLEAALARLDSIRSGATQEDVALAESKVSSVETRLESANTSLQDTDNTTMTSLNSAYQGISSLIGSSHDSIWDAKEGTEDIIDAHFSGVITVEARRARSARSAIVLYERSLSLYAQRAVDRELPFEEKDESLDNAENMLSKTMNELDVIIDAAESRTHRDIIPTEQVQNVRTLRGQISSELAKVEAAIQGIETARSQRESSMSSAENQVREAERALEEAQRSLEQVRAGSREENIREQEARVQQARARVQQVERRMSDLSLRSPATGVISTTHMRAGEVAPSGQPVISVMPEQDFQIEIDIYEGDIPKVSQGNRALVSFVAFPDEEYEGSVVSVNPAGKVEGGVVYYQTTVLLDSYPDGVMNRMTADVTIISEERNNALFIPDRAVHERDDEKYVRVIDDGSVKEIGIETGITAEGRRVEVTQGLKEGQRVLIE